MSDNVKNRLLVQGSILAAAGIITKIIGFVYRIPMANVLGNQGNGIYSVAFGIYNIALTLSSYSLPLAVSKLVSARLARKEYRNSHKVFLMALLFGAVVGTIACALLWFGADKLELIYHRNGLALPLRVLAPTTLVVAILGVFRGLLQGNSNMVPTAISQILEQIVNAFVSVIAAVALTRAYAGSPLQPAYGAAGGTLGTLFGAVTALLFFILVYFIDRPVIMKKNRLDKTKSESAELLMKALIITILPVILSQTIYQIGYTIDDLIYGNIMALQHIDDRVASSVQGVFNTQYNQLINLPVAVATAMAASTVPGIVRARINGDQAATHHKMELVLKFNMAIAIPSAMGLTVIGEPIVALLFPSLTEYQHLAGMLLLTGSSAVVFYALSTITTAILQGSDLMRVPVYHSAVSLGIHVVLVYVLLRYSPLGVYGLVIGNVTFPLLVSIMNCISLRTRLDFVWKPGAIFVKPLFASCVMGAATVLSFRLVLMVTGISVIALAVSLVIAFVVYGFVLLRSRCFTKEELYELPMGGRIARFVK